MACADLLKQSIKKSLASGDRWSGSFGGPLDEAMWNMADTGCEYRLLHGGLPVAISMTVQARDQMSAGRPWPVCLMTSGAIQ
jgi:hypothetical protein